MKKEKHLVTFTDGGVVKLTKRHKDLRAELQAELLKMFEDKYHGVPMLVMNNISIKSIELKDGQSTFYFKDKDSRYIVKECKLMNGNKKNPIIK